MEYSYTYGILTPALDALGSCVLIFHGYVIRQTGEDTSRRERLPLYLRLVTRLTEG